MTGGAEMIGEPLLTDGPGATGGPALDQRLTRLSPNLWWFRDTCNVYLWTSGEQGLLIDFGSGGILDVLGSTGVQTTIVFGGYGKTVQGKAVFVKGQ